MKYNYKKIILWLLFITISLNSFAENYTVSSHQEFNALNLVAGDVVTWSNGVYSDDGNIKFLGTGTETNPIILKSETPGGVQFTGRMTMDIGGSYLLVDGFYWNGGEGASNFIEFRSDPVYSDHCTIQNCVIDGLFIDPDDKEEAANPDDPDDSPSIPKHRWVVLHGNYNNVLNCTFRNKSSAGALVLVELEYNAFSLGEDDPLSTNTRSELVGHTISNNYFFNYTKIDASLSNAGDSETIRVGTSEYQNVNCGTIVSNNYFVQADGENEIITNKSRNNKYINNTFRRCRGSLVLRHGAGATVQGNVFLGEGIEGTGGLRIVDSDHIISNNYIQNCINVADQAKWNNGITIMGGNDKSVTDPNTTSVSNGYQKSENIQVFNNTIVNTNAPIFFNGAKGKNNTSGDFENNIVYYDSTVSTDLLTDVITGDDSDSFSEINALAFSGNVFNNTDLGETATGFSETTMTSTANGEIFDITGANGKGADLGDYTPSTDALVGNGVGACFLDSEGKIIANPVCVVEGVEPIDTFSTSISDFSASAGDQDITITSNISWTAVSNEDWITIDTNSGEGNATVKVSVAKNEVFESRTGSITFNQVDGDIEYTLSVTQEAADIKSNLSLINDNSDTDNVTVVSAFAEEVTATKNNVKENTLDKNFDTQWSGEGYGGDIIFNLGGTFDLALVDFATTSGKTYEFQIWVSTTGTEEGDFVDAFADQGNDDGNLVSNSTGEFKSFILTNVAENVKYVKIIGYGQPGRPSPWNTIKEIEFYTTNKDELSVQENLLNAVSIYPIPSKGTLYFKNVKINIGKLEVLNLEGKTMLTKNAGNSNNALSMDVSNLKNGLYVLKITSTDGYSSMKKIIIHQ